MSDLLSAKDKVQRYLLDMGIRPEVTDSGGWTFRTGSSRVFVGVREIELGDGSKSTIIDVSAPLLMNVQQSAELWEYVALNTGNWIFGHLWAEIDADDRTISLLLSHRLLGDYIDPEELKRTVGAIAGTGEALDDALQAKFGGARFHEEDVSDGE